MNIMPPDNTNNDKTTATVELNYINPSCAAPSFDSVSSDKSNNSTAIKMDGSVHSSPKVEPQFDVATTKNLKPLPNLKM